MLCLCVPMLVWFYFKLHGKQQTKLCLNSFFKICLSKSIGMFGAKSAAIQAPFILLLLPITYYMFTWTTGTFRAPSKHLNLMESKDVCFFFPIFFSYLIHWCVCVRGFFLK